MPSHDRTPGPVQKSAGLATPHSLTAVQAAIEMASQMRAQLPEHLTPGEKTAGMLLEETSQVSSPYPLSALFSPDGMAKTAAGFNFAPEAVTQKLWKGIGGGYRRLSQYVSSTPARSMGMAGTTAPRAAQAFTHGKRLHDWLGNTGQSLSNWGQGATAPRGIGALANAAGAGLRGLGQIATPERYTSAMRGLRNLYSGGMQMAAPMFQRPRVNVEEVTHPGYFFGTLGRRTKTRNVAGPSHIGKALGEPGIPGTED